MCDGVHKFTVGEFIRLRWCPSDIDCVKEVDQTSVTSPLIVVAIFFSSGDAERGGA